MSDQKKPLPAQPQYPTTNGRDAWLDYWQKCGQSWRTEHVLQIRDFARLCEYYTFPFSQNNIY